ncbi:MAG TPA: hypothetical protein VF653_03510 [Methylomirabilota bacterium]
MDYNEYAAQMIVAHRLAELREQGARLALLRRDRPSTRWDRIAAGLIRLGHRLAPGRPPGSPNAGVRLAR